ncbi:unnamed protein product, partial [Trichogramma brassicae]
MAEYRACLCSRAAHGQPATAYILCTVRKSSRICTRARARQSTGRLCRTERVAHKLRRTRSRYSRGVMIPILEETVLEIIYGPANTGHLVETSKFLDREIDVWARNRLVVIGGCRSRRPNQPSPLSLTHTIFSSDSSEGSGHFTLVDGSEPRNPDAGCHPNNCAFDAISDQTGYPASMLRRVVTQRMMIMLYQSRLRGRDQRFQCSRLSRANPMQLGATLASRAALDRVVRDELSCLETYYTCCAAARACVICVSIARAEHDTAAEATTSSSASTAAAAAAAAAAVPPTSSRSAYSLTHTPMFFSAIPRIRRRSARRVAGGKGRLKGQRVCKSCGHIGRHSSGNSCTRAHANTGTDSNAFKVITRETRRFPRDTSWQRRTSSTCTTSVSCIRPLYYYYMAYVRITE